MSLRTEVIADPDRLDSLAGGWDKLAVASARPFCAPGWLLPWWEHAAPEDARLHAVAVHEGDGLVGLAPFFVGPDPGGTALHPLGTGPSMRVEPLAPEGREREVAAVLAPGLAAAGASLLRLNGVPATSPWPELLAESWPGRRPSLHEDERMPAPNVFLEAMSFDDWFASKSGSFRKQIRSFRRKLNERGGRMGLVRSAAALPAALDAFARLHHARWADRGGSAVLNPGVEAAVAAAARALPTDRFRLFVIESPEGPVAANLLIAAGGEVGSWLGGHDDGWGDLSPQLLLSVATIEHAFDAGDTRLDLGPGLAEDKQRLANRGETLRWVTLVPRGSGYASTRLRLLPRQTRLAVSRRLSDEQKRRIKRLLRRPH